MNAVVRTLVAILVAIAILPWAAGPASATSPLSGTVTINGDTTTPVNGYINATVPGSGSASGWTITNGSFSVPAAADGDYKFYVSITTMDGLRRWYKEGAPAGVPDEASATLVHLASAPVSMHWELDPIATLTGTVKDGAGNGVADASVNLNRRGMVRSTKADASGAYSLGYVLPGLVTLSARGPDTLAGAAVQVTLPETGAALQDFVLLPRGHIEGTVTDATSGDPIEDINVSAFALTGSYGGTTDADGHYVIYVDPGDFVLRFDDQAFASYVATYNGGAEVYDDAPTIPVASEATVTYDETLARNPDPRAVEHTLGGVLTDAAGTPLGGILVTATHATDAYSTSTDRWGRWALGAPGSLLPDQAYLLRAEQGWQLDTLYPDLVPWFPEYFPNEWTAATATSITVAGNTQDTLDMALERAARLTVTASAAGTAPLHTGYRVLTPAGVTAVSVPATTSSPASPAILLRPGTWKILASGFRGSTAPGTRLLPKWLGGGVSLSTSGSFAVTPGQKRATSVTLPSSLKATTNPRIKGTPKVGRTLTATRGSWNLMTGTTFKFVWYRGTKVIGRTATHVVVRADRGRTIKVRVTAINGTFKTTVTRRISVP